ncbi:CBS domain-containing protein [Telmatocola sphagniphila]|uniref:CBS domain-containing protein n=1 Tax=Telmatocola sphagniphila TaxID=1123043 RepID=A0A8E6B7S8_9BACT|nr:CBS domain-containing protein [Telmatocola sphagniphila]QVL33462.1 CBS domain-containing protein [Telmatocola sphagniphila]
MELTRNLRVDTVSRLDPTPPRQIEVTRPVSEAVTLMRQERVGCILVCEKGRLVGLFTERDLLNRIMGTGRPLTVTMDDCMTPTPVTVHRRDSIRTAIKKMQGGGYRHLPVVDDNNIPVGILSVKRIVHYLVEHFPAAIYNLPPDAKNLPSEREGA